MGARYYSPTLGRFLQTDPIGTRGGNNLYAYVGNDPINLLDPLGLCGESILDKGIAAVENAWTAATSNPLLGMAMLATEVLGGGPEDPLADAAVAGEVALAEGTGAAAEATETIAGGAESAVAPAAPDFVVTPAGEAIPVPEGATGPYPTTNNAGFQYNGGSGGNGLADNVTDVRIMNPNANNPTGYVNYGSAQSNGGWQTVDPYSGQAVPPTSPSWHITLLRW